MQASLAIFRSSASDTPGDGPFLDAPIARSRSPFAGLGRFPWRFVALLLLTAAAGVVRFTRLDNPTVWTDEVATFRRVCGTFDQMLDTLREEPFGPLFYEGEWAMRHLHALTPFWLRLLPAIASTLTVPAMYFLARQLVSVRTALLAATFTLCSAWMINYGRDAKMYGEFWLFVVLYAGAFFCWLRTHSWTSWLAWIAAGCAMLGLNPWGGLLVAMSPVWLITARRVHWVMGIGLIVGIAIVSAGPAGFFGLFNHWGEHGSRMGTPNVWWIRDRNDNADALELLRDTSAALTLCFTYLQEGFRQEKPVPPAGVLAGVTCGLTVIGGLAMLGLLPWLNGRKRRRDTIASSTIESSPSPPPTSRDPHAALIGQAFGGGEIRSRVRPLEQVDAAERLPSYRVAPEPAWRAGLWLSMWLAVPLYVFYCLSLYDHPTSPSDAFVAAQDFIRPHGMILLVSLGLLTMAMSIYPIVVRIGLAVIAAGVAITAAWAAVAGWHESTNAARDWQGLMLGVDRWVQLVTDARFLLPITVIGIAASVARAGRTWRERIAALLLFAFAAAVLVGLLAAAQPACAMVIQSMKDRGLHPSTLWLPRYQGFIWPAMAIAMSALLLRLPTRPLRWSAIALLLGMNLAAGGARVLGHTEPPIDRMVLDAHDAQNSGGHTRLFVGADYPSGPGPSSGRIDGEIGAYYLQNQRTDLSPWSFDDERVFGLTGIRHTTSPDAVARNASSSAVNRLIVWFPDRTEGDEQSPRKELLADKISPRLGSAWRLDSEQVFPVRYFWCWAERYVLYRREYVRASSATTKPAMQMN